MMNNDIPNTIHVQVTPGFISYKDKNGKDQTFYFQCNPTSLTRSRAFSQVDSRASNGAQGSKTATGEVGRKFTHKASTWTLDAIELWFDASMPHWSGGKYSERDGLNAVKESIQHLEAISEPIPLSSENASQSGAPPFPSPPLITLTLGTRSWSGYVSSLSILEKDFTPDLVPKQLKVTLGLSLIITDQQLKQDKTGALK